MPWVSKLDGARYGVLLNIAFQMGVDGLLGFEYTLELIRTGRYDKAADGMINSLWAKQTPARAERLANQIRSGVWA